MTKKIVLSVNWNPDYLYYLPICAWAWRKIGWEPVVFYHGPISGLTVFTFETAGVEMIKLSDIDGYRSDTITQVSRLYAACTEEGYLMTGDIDMIPLSDYWKYDESDITIWGHDLTGYKHYPICYIGMTHQRWVEVMGLSSSNYDALIKRDLDTLPQAKDPDFYKYWFSDQDLITTKIDQTEFKKTIINRGQYANGYAKGRIDRGSWSLLHDQFIDCHMLRDIYKRSDTGFGNFSKTRTMLEKIWPESDFQWFQDYTLQYQKMANNG